MKCEFIHSCGSDRLILIFAGWSTEACFYSNVEVNGYDVMVVSDYSDLYFPDEILARYSTVCLFAWSLGVFAAARSLRFDRIALAVAINGTEQPADDDFGIPEKIFYGTADDLNERNLMKFRRRMAGRHFECIKERFNETSVDDLRNQLLFIGREAHISGNIGKWDCAYISSGDAIFPPDNQLKFWRAFHPSADIRYVDSPHLLDLPSLVAGIVAERNAIGEKFRKALPSYERHAGAQKKIAEHLVGMIPRQNYRRVLEIGPGSGLLTNLFVEKFSPEEMDFIDLYELPRFNAASVENYLTGDAEDLVESLTSTSGCYDAIISASSVQWFVNHPKFFRNASRLLKKDGVLACSTFVAGNLSELMEVNPFCIVYRSPDRLIEMIGTCFNETSFEDDKITVDFPDARQLMLHLQKTGVGGTAKSTLTLSETLKRLPSRLTYKPFYIIARK